MAQFTAPKQLRLVVAMKPEVTAGTDVLADSYISTDVLPVIQDSIRFTQDPNEIQNMMTAGRLGRAPSILGKLTARLDFAMWIRGAGAAYAAGVKPELDMPLRACGLSMTLVTTGGSEKVTYQPTDTEEVFSAYVVQEIPGAVSNWSAQMVGCLATGRIAGRAGEPMRAEFSVFGSLKERQDITPGGFTAGRLSTTPAYPTLKSAAFQIGAADYAPRIANVGFDIGNTVNMIESINAAGAVAGYKIFDRNPRLTLDPEVDRETNSGWWTALNAGSPLMDCTFQLGTVQYNRLKFQFAAGGSAAQLQLVQQSLAARDGLSIFPSTLLATIVNGNDDFALVFD